MNRPIAADCNPASLFTALWEALGDLLGWSATATVIGRSIKRAAARSPLLRDVVIRREGLEYRYSVPASWSDPSGAQAAEALRVLAGELEPLLAELTGTVVLQRLRSVPELARCRVFSSEEGGG